MSFKHFASKNQLPGFDISGTLVEYGLIKPYHALKILNLDISDEVKLFSLKLMFKVTGG